MAKINLLVAEIGSTTTVVNAFDFAGPCPKFVGQGQAFTSVEEGDVNVGINQAIEALKERNNLTQNDKISALKLVTDSNIKNIINAI